MADKQSREEVVNKAKEIGKQSEESGKRVGDALKDLTVKISVDVDVSDAITGLKAVQREAKEATKALRGVEAQSGDVRVTLDSERLAKELFKPTRASQFFRRELSEFTTDELTDELAKRKEVAEYLLEDNARATIDFGNGYDAIVNAPVRVYVVSDGERE